MCGVGSWTIQCRQCGGDLGVKWQDIGTVLPYNYEDGKLIVCHALGNGTVCCFVKWRRRNDDTCGADPTKVWFKTCDKDACQDADRRLLRQMEATKASQEVRRGRKESSAYSERVRELVEGAAAEDEEMQRRYRSRRPVAQTRTQRLNHRQENPVTGLMGELGDQSILDVDWVGPTLQLNQDMEEWERIRQQTEERQLQQRRNTGESVSRQSHRQHKIENDRLKASLQLEQEAEKHRRIDEYTQEYRQRQPRNNLPAPEPFDESWFQEFVQPGAYLLDKEAMRL